MLTKKPPHIREEIEKYLYLYQLTSFPQDRILK